MFICGIALFINTQHHFLALIQRITFILLNKIHGPLAIFPYVLNGTQAATTHAIPTLIAQQLFFRIDKT
jgi:hypothetical protein